MSAVVNLNQAARRTGDGRGLGGDGGSAPVAAGIEDNLAGDRAGILPGRVLPRTAMVALPADPPAKFTRPPSPRTVMVELAAVEF